MYGFAWPPYVKVADRKKQAARTITKMNKNGKKLSPVQIEGRKIAKTFWGKAWCDHLESFSDMINRLPRGRTYVRNGSVLDLKIAAGVANALVQGSSLYKVQISIRAIGQEKWRLIKEKCSGEIGSVIELLQGKISASVMTIITDKKNGLFPAPNELTMKCSCPDWSEMCKHVAATIYGIGARLDEEPELLFTLRKADHLELIEKAAMKMPAKGSSKTKIIQDQDLSSLFGVDISDEVSPPIKAKKPKIVGKATKKKKR